MKTNTKTSFNASAIAVLFATNAFFVQPSLAEDAVTQPLSSESASKELPTAEKAFVDAINKFDKKKIVAQLGEPAKADDVRLKDSDTVVASIWQYHNINTAEDGSFYPTTELDFVDDKVVQVVFLNNDGSEKDVNGQTYEIPQSELPKSPANLDAPVDGMPLKEIK